MSNWKPAVSSTGPVLFVRNNEVIGKGRVAIRRADDWIGVEIAEGKIVEETKDLGIVKVLGLKYAYIKFSPLSGNFDERFYGVNNEEDTLKYFEYIRVVDEFNLRFGMVPDTFKDVPGYRSAFEHEESAEKA